MTLTASFEAGEGYPFLLFTWVFFVPPFNLLNPGLEPRFTPLISWLVEFFTSDFGWDSGHVC